jgi:hypothetical protein
LRVLTAIKAAVVDGSGWCWKAKPSNASPNIFNSVEPTSHRQNYLLLLL